MNKTLARQISERALNALKNEFGNEFDVLLSSGVYGDTFSFAKFQFVEQTASGKDLSLEGTALRENLKIYGYEPALVLSHVYMYSGKAYHLTGYKSKNRRYPWIAVDLFTGQKYKLTDKLIVQILASISLPKEDLEDNIKSLKRER